MTTFKRPLKTLDNKTGAKIKSIIQSIDSDHDRYKKCYFWTSTGNASQRRSQEFTRGLDFTFSGIHYEITQDLSISCKNFYYNCDIRKDGKKSNITALRKLI